MFQIQILLQLYQRAEKVTKVKLMRVLAKNFEWYGKFQNYDLSTKTTKPMFFKVIEHANEIFVTVKPSLQNTIAKTFNLVLNLSLISNKALILDPDIIP